ncbi:rhodanese-like domain-containing protein [Kaarinaea lacus]
MKRIVLIVTSLISLLGIQPGITAEWEAPVVVDGATPVTAEELSDLMSQMDNLVLIDSRHSEQFKDGAIKGSISLPDTQTSPAALSQLVPNKMTPVVFYCEGLSCPHSMKAVRKAVSYGYINIFWFRGGISEWTEKGFPVVNN